MYTQPYKEGDQKVTCVNALAIYVHAVVECAFTVQYVGLQKEEPVHSVSALH